MRQRPFGVTKGCVSLSKEERPEQVYVYLDDPADPKVTETHVDYGTVSRPIRVDSMVGYALDGRMRLTRNQAIELAGVLLEAVKEVDEPTPRPVEPCMDPNPWPGDNPPCGRPKGHKTHNWGRGGNWGTGHSEKPAEDDPPVKSMVRRWVVG